MEHNFIENDYGSAEDHDFVQRDRRPLEICRFCGCHLESEDGEGDCPGKPIVQLSGEDGNIFGIIARCQRVLKKIGKSQEEIKEFQGRVVNSGGFDSALQIIMREFDVH